MTQQHTTPSDGEHLIATKVIQLVDVDPGFLEALRLTDDEVARALAVGSGPSSSGCPLN